MFGTYAYSYTQTPSHTHTTHIILKSIVKSFFLFLHTTWVSFVVTLVVIQCVRTKGTGGGCDGWLRQLKHRSPSGWSRMNISTSRST